MKLTPYPALHNYPLSIPVKQVLIVIAIALVVGLTVAVICRHICFKNTLCFKNTDDLGTFARITVCIALLIIIAIMFGAAFNANSVMEKNINDVRDIRQSSISTNIKKAESYYGINDISIDTSKDYIMLTSVGRNDRGLNNRDARLNQKLKDEESRRGVVISNITFSMDGKEYSGIIKNNTNGTINIFKNDGEMLQKKQ